MCILILVNTFLSLFSNKTLLIRARIYTIVDRISNIEDLDQTASSEDRKPS